MTFLLVLRLRQVFRALRAAGWGVLALLLLVTAGLWLPALAGLAGVSPWGALGAGCLLAFGLQSSRADASLVAKMHVQPWKVYFTDTALLLTPGVLLLALQQHWLGALAFAGGLMAIFLPPGRLAGVRGRRNRWTVPGLPADLFEGHAAGRRMPLGWLLALLLQGGVWWHIGFFLAAVALGLMLIAALFEYAEPRILLPSDRSALLRKWRRYAGVLHVFFLPAYLQALVFQPPYYGLVFYALAAIETMLALAYFNKYALWRPGLVRLGGSVLTSIGTVLVLLPGGILAAAPLAVWTARKALRRIVFWV